MWKSHVSKYSTIFKIMYEVRMILHLKNLNLARALYSANSMGLLLAIDKCGCVYYTFVSLTVSNLFVFFFVVVCCLILYSIVYQ